MYAPYGEACVYKNGDNTVILQGQPMTEYLNKFDVGAQHTCYHPVGNVNKITFTAPPRSDGLLLSFTMLLPFVLLCLFAAVLHLHKPKPAIETMVRNMRMYISRKNFKVALLV